MAHSFPIDAPSGLAVAVVVTILMGTAKPVCKPSPASATRATHGNNSVSTQLR